ncbi:MAG TPA: hypothetical protein VEY95_09540 [Azospirillaceae bacterium]|nr:hypothetical protein [Azospirillaceae bacterium]
MSDETSIASPELTGGAGFTFEDRVVAIYLGALLGEAPAPGTPGRHVIGVEVQRAAFGQPMDDLIVKAAGGDGSAMTLALQVKRTLTISDAQTNADFRSVVAMGWTTLNRPGFQVGIDRIGAVTGSIAKQSKRAVETICEWARLSPTAADFLARFIPGAAGKAQREARDAFEAVLRATHASANYSDLHRLLASFVLVTCDLLHEGSVDEPRAIAVLQPSLTPGDAGRADDLFWRLTQIARDAAGHAGQFTRPILLGKLRGRFKFTPAPSLQDDLRRLRAEAERALADIADEIDGFHVPRDDAVGTVHAGFGATRFVQLSGLPGVGKSVVLRRLAGAALDAGPALVLKADRLEGRGWAGYAAHRGLTGGDLAALLAEIGGVGTPVLFIDGLDRVETEHRAIVNDILNLLADRPELADWRVVATVRDNGLEPLRTWLSPRWLAGGATIVEVKPLSDPEAEALAVERPHLRPLLFGSAALRELTRRPFFMAVLSRLPSSAGLATENDLVEAWWRAGGYDAPPLRARERQDALLALAHAGAATLGRRMPVRVAAPIAIEELRADGVVRDLRAGHTVAFCHDIYFEWAFLHLLIEQGDAWPKMLREVGEPPVLGRVVELLAQLYFKEPPIWADHLGRLEQSGLRAQWTRAWLLGPFASADFPAHADQMAAAAFNGAMPRLAKLAVWFQAEKSTPNPVILRQADGTRDVQLVLRAADMFAWPSDFGAWGRFLNWLLAQRDRIPRVIAPDVLSVFEVWQNALADLPNPRSAALLDLAQVWLDEIERLRHSENWTTQDWGGWDTIRGDLDDLERRLRQLLLRATRAYPEQVETYLDRMAVNDRLGRAALEDVIQHSPVLASVMPARLVTYTLGQILDELPEDRDARLKKDGEYHFYGRIYRDHEWENLSIRREFGVFPAATPTAMPFAALFAAAPDEGRCLVRSICNHAVTAWRQLHGLDPTHAGRPLPLMLKFPWGPQTFWGNGQVYAWFRAIWGPTVVQAGLMALEAWALGQLDQGAALDNVIHDVVEGHNGCAVLGIATTLLLRAQNATPAGVALIGSARLWEYDLQRWQHDRGLNPNVIAFAMSPGSKDHQAVLTGNALPLRRMTLRDLAPIFVLCAEDDIRTASQAAIQAFESNPPVEDEAELQDADRLAAARRIGAIWSALGDPSTYQARRSPDNRRIEIQHKNPHADDPDVKMQQAHAARMNDAAGLLLWARDSFEMRAVSTKLPLAEVLTRARGFDCPDLFEKPREIGFGSMVQSGVAGVAAAALAFAGLDPEDEVWARATIFRAVGAPEPVDMPFVAQSAVPDHPVSFAALGLAAIISSGRDIDLACERLLALVAHPLHAVACTALKATMDNWAVDRPLAWVALDMAIRLSIGRRRDESWRAGDDESARQAAALAAFEAAQERLRLPVTDTRLCALPPAWIQVLEKRQRGRRRDAMSPLESEWREPDTFLRWDFLRKALTTLPIDSILADADYRDTFLAFCDDLLSWTLQRLTPPWTEVDPSEQRHRRATELLEWRGALGRFLALVGLHLPADMVQARFLAPLSALDDDLAFSILAPFIGITSSAGLLDPPDIAPSALASLNACLDRVLRARAWKQARYRDGDVDDHNLTNIIRDLMGVTHTGFPRSSRFANDDWSQLGLIFPMVQRLVAAVGNVPLVANTFLTLCERALPFVPAAAFAELALSMVAGHCPPTGWRASMLPGRLAATIHAVAEQAHPMPPDIAQALLRTLDILVDLGDRRSAALQISETFKDVRLHAQAT